MPVPAAYFQAETNRPRESSYGSGGITNETLDYGYGCHVLAVNANRAGPRQRRSESLPDSAGRICPAGRLLALSSVGMQQSLLPSSSLAYVPLNAVSRGSTDLRTQTEVCATAISSCHGFVIPPWTRFLELRRE